jgi:hypothetical protein
MEWTKEIQRLWGRVHGAYGYGPWRVTSTPVTVAPYGVVGASGKDIVAVGDPDLAALIAALPDLCDPDLRPREDFDSIGIATPEHAHEDGWKSGYAVGRSEMLKEALGIVNVIRASTEGGIAVQHALAKVAEELEAIRDEEGLQFDGEAG